jgi:G3E family GTPase
VAFADKILLNKLDLVTPEQKAAVVARIKVSGPAWLAG